MVEWGLPLHTSPSPSELGDNDHIVSCFFPRSEGCPKRRLSCCFDRTYLSSAVQLCHTSRGHTLCGGAHRPPHFIQEDQSQIVIRREKGQEQFRTSDLIRANEMESIVCWDTSRQHSNCFEVSAMPVTSAAARMKEFEASLTNPKNKRGQFETCHRIGMILQHCESIRFLICDSHGSHEWVKKLMLGMNISLPESLQSQIPFFKDLVYHDLPKCNIVLGYRSASYKGEAVFWMPGPQHLAKNLCEQLRSHLRTVHFGSRAAVFSGCLELGMAPAAYLGHDTMSDWQAALMIFVREIFQPFSTLINLNLVLDSFLVCFFVLSRM